MGLVIEDLNFRYSSKFGIQQICTDFGNHITAILGPNGSGKSTLLKCITNLYKWVGNMYYEGKKIEQIDKNFFRSKLSYLPQTTSNDANITVYEAILLGLIHSLSIRITNDQIQAVNHIMDQFELDHLANKPINELSGGQLQMVLLAQAIIKKPDILLLDEPLNNLDIHRQFSLLDQITMLTKKFNMVTVIVMHDINLAARYADHILIMKEGGIYSQGSPREVITKQMMREIYAIDSNIYENQSGHCVTEFIGIAK